jgi:hypothetical protein
MGFLDKLLGRDKKTSSDSSMQSEGMHQGHESMGGDKAPGTEPPMAPPDPQPPTESRTDGEM